MYELIIFFDYLNKIFYILKIISSSFLILKKFTKILNSEFE